MTASAPAVVDARRRALHWVLKIGNLSKLMMSIGLCDIPDTLRSSFDRVFTHRIFSADCCSSEKSLTFFEKVLGLKVLRHEEFDSGCEGESRHHCS